MPVRVKCPNGCVFHVPESRAGKAIRCPECKAAIRLSGKVKKTDAKKKVATAVERVVPSTTVDQPPDKTAKDLATNVNPDILSSISFAGPLPDPGSNDPAIELSPIQTKSESESVSPSISPPAAEPSTKSKSKKSFPKSKPSLISESTQSAAPDSANPATEEKMPSAPATTKRKKKKRRSTENRKTEKNDTKSGLAEPSQAEKDKAVRKRQKENERIAAAAQAKIQELKEKEKRLLETPDFLNPAKNKSVTEPVPAMTPRSIASEMAEEEILAPKISPAMRERLERRKKSDESGPQSFDPDTFMEESEDREQRLLNRVRSSNSERVTLARFFAVCLCIVAAINLIPAVYHWYQWSAAESKAPLARWIYLQVFIAAIHVLYAIYLVQIPDWSALRSVAVAMLAIAAIFGLVSTGLLMGGNEGRIAKFLHLPYVLARSAAIWCVAMLCLSTLMTYLSGRESLNWQRTEQLLREILAKQVEPAGADDSSSEPTGTV